MSKKDSTEKIGKWESQVRKGMLDFIILICLEKREFYGYELIKAIKDTTEISVSEGTIYPLLNRLKNDEFITSKWVEMETGIPRKYYQLTPGGKKLLTDMKRSWKQFSSAVQQLLEEQ